MTLVQWAGGHSSSSSLLLRLDDVHNLSLLGRLISVAVPALIQASKHRVDAALRVLTIFVRGLPDLPANLPRRALALYAGLLRGLAQVVAAPVSTHLDTALCSGNQISPGTGRKITKQAALQGWLWTATLIFLNTEWPSQETGMVYSSLLSISTYHVNINTISKSLLWSVKCHSKMLQSVTQSTRPYQHGVTLWVC